MVRKVLLVVGWALIALLISDWAFAAPVPDTGQTKCYNNSAEFPCPQPGQPSYGQDGNCGINPPSYVKKP